VWEAKPTGIKEREERGGFGQKKEVDGGRGGIGGRKQKKKTSWGADTIDRNNPPSGIRKNGNMDSGTNTHRVPRRLARVESGSNQKKSDFLNSNKIHP